MKQSESGIATFKDKLITLEDPAGTREALFVSFQGDGTMLVGQPDEDAPPSAARLDGYPTDERVLASVARLRGKEARLVSVQDRSVDLDRSALAGLAKMPVDVFDDVYLGEVKNKALVLCVDVRNFSDFLCCNDEADVFRLIKDFTSNLLSCVNQFGYGCSYYKLMGDGAIVIWDEADAASVAEALAVFDTYTDFLDEDLFAPYPALGLGGALVMDKVFKYEISAEASQLKYRDYVGYGINLACRLQALARRDQLAVNQALADTGLLPVRPAEGVAEVELAALKGLKEVDRSALLLYSRPETE